MSNRTRPFTQAALLFACCAFMVAAAVVLWAEHSAHMWGALPYLLLLACPLAHLLLHGSHGTDHSAHSGGTDDA